MSGPMNEPLELGDKRVMAQALIPTTWFTDYWLDYKEQAAANLREATVHRGGAGQRRSEDRGARQFNADTRCERTGE